MAAVLRLLRGEDLDVVSRELGVTAAALSGWREAFLAGGQLIPIEVKLSATPRPAMTGGIKTFQKDFGEKAGPGYLVHPGDVRLPLAPEVTAMPLGEF